MKVFIVLMITPTFYLFYRLKTNVGISAIVQGPKASNTTSPESSKALPKAYIITENCSSLRFTATKQNIERVFPRFFDIVCHLPVPLNDSRIHTSSVLLWKKFSSNLLTFVDLWTTTIQNDSSRNGLDWAFIFEDDVDFVDPSAARLTNYISPLQEFMDNREIQLKHGFFYLGICGPSFDINGSQPIILSNTNGTLQARRGYGFCLHATGITKSRANLLWSEIASYRPNPDNVALDYQLRLYSLRSKIYFYTLGSNFHYPPGTGHHGVAYQDRRRFSTTIA